MLSGEFNHMDLAFEDFVKNDLRVRVDTGELLLEEVEKTQVAKVVSMSEDSQLCPAYLKGHCPLGSKCPLRHVKPSVLNFRAPSPPPSSAHARTVCKHWLRGLCKKGSACEFLHEYNLRKMPECWFFAKYAYCSSGDECMYLHIGPEERRGECKGYARGFCPKGEISSAPA
jgi:cleavage and polyadenylation specificity factor subunit 4